METVNPYFLLLRASAAERKEQYRGQACLGCGTQGTLLIHVTVFESVLILSVGDKECLLTGSCEMCPRSVTGGYYHYSPCRLYSPKELEIFFGRLRVLFPISMQVVKTQGKWKKEKSLCTFYRGSKGSTPIFQDCRPLAGLAFGFKATLMMN